MIIENKRNNYLKRLPFSASFDKEKMIVTFYEGYIFNCFNYNKNSSQSYKNGSYFKKTRNNSEKFSVSIGDQFFVSTEGLIYKVSKTQRESGFSHSGVMIWEAPTEEKGEGQGLSENLFIQDYEANRQKGFQITKIKEDEGKDYYRINSGFVFAPQLGYSKFLKGFEFSKPKGNEIPRFTLKVEVRAAISGPNPIGDANMSFINNYSITSCVLEEATNKEDETIILSQYGLFLDGTYYADVSGEGNINLFFNVMTGAQAFINPAVETEVKGATFYKNGVFFGFGEDEEVYGYYEEYSQIATYQKRLNTEGVITDAGEWTSTTRFYIEDTSSPISLEDPEILTEVFDDGDIGEDEFLVTPPEITYEKVGSEISDRAYNECKSIVQNEQEWINTSSWTGDGAVIVDGAGSNGSEEKTLTQVTYTERRFKKVGIPDLTSAALPQNYTWYGGILYLGESNIDDQESLGFKFSKGVYISQSFFEIPHSPTQGVFGKEYIKNDCEAQALGGYSTINITRFVYDAYQTLTMTSSADSIV